MLIWNTTSEECFQPFDEEVKAAVKVNRLQPSISIMKPNVLRQESGTFVLEQLEHRRRFFQEPQSKLHLRPFHSRERHTSPQPTSLKLHTNTHKIKKKCMHAHLILHLTENLRAIWTLPARHQTADSW